MRSKALWVAVCILAAAAVAGAQSITGTIVGTVSDQSGAVLPGVEITIQNLATNQTRTAITSERGEYSVPLIPIGEYSVTAGLPGFRTEVRPKIAVQVDAHVKIDFTLQVGEISDKVLVTEEAPLVQATSASLGNVVDNRKIQELPLNSRDFNALALLVPGATPPQNGSGNQYRGGMNIGGGHERANNFSYDGMNITSGNVFTYAFKPSVDEIQEFKVLPNSYDAESGRGEGGMVVVTSKSGSNAFHGGVFEFIRNEKFDAHNFFDAPGSRKPPFKRSQFGGNLGGRIFKDKTFFFVNYEGLKRRESDTATATVPTPKMHSGDFSELATPIRDPLTGQPFQGNFIPPDRMDAFGKTLMAWYPLPDSNGICNHIAGFPVSCHLTAGTVGNLITTPRATEDSAQQTIRLDHTFSPKDTLFARYSLWRDTFIDPYNQYSGFSNIPYPRLDIQHNHAVTLSYTHVFSPTLLNTAKAGFSRLKQARSPLPGQPDFLIQVQPQIPIPGVLALAVNPRITGIPAARPTGYDPIGYAGNQPDGRSDLDYQYTDTLSWTKGSHSMKFGADLARFQIFRYNFSAAARGDYRFNAVYTGNSIADMLLGYPNAALRSFGGANHYWFENQFAGFVQDDWKFSPRLTVNLGIRIESFTPWWEKFGRESNWNPTTPNTIYLAGSPTPKREYQRGDQMDPAVAAYSSSFSFVDLKSKWIWNVHYPLNWMPRVGFAWDVFGNSKFLMRGGSGIFFVSRDTDYNQGHNFPFRISQTFNNPQPNATTHLLSNGTFTLDSPFAGTASSSTTLSANDTNYPRGYVHKYSLGLEYQFLPDFVLDLDYSGYYSRKLTDTYNINQPPPGSGAIASRTYFPKFGAITWRAEDGNGIYNALQSRVERRFSDGMTILNSFTWQKVMADISSNGGGLGEAGFQDPFNRRAHYGPAAYDFRFRWVFSMNYLIPAGRGHRFLGNAPAVVDGVLGGWELSAIQTFQTGGPLTPILSSDNANTGGTNYPNRIGDGNLPKSQRTIDHYFDTSAFVKPPQYTFGNSGRNIIYGPSFSDLDFSLMKLFKVREVQDLQFRSEFFNLLNHPSFALPNNVIGAATAGHIFQTVGTPRQIQFGLKYRF